MHDISAFVVDVERRLLMTTAGAVEYAKKVGWEHKCMVARFVKFLQHECEIVVDVDCGEVSSLRPLPELWSIPRRSGWAGCLSLSVPIHTQSYPVLSDTILSCLLPMFVCAEPHTDMPSVVPS